MIVVIYFDVYCAVDAAERNVDFGDKDQQITFLPSEPLRTQKCFTVQTYNDSVYEGEEQYGVHMSFDYKFTEVNSPARIYIRDNDGEEEIQEGEREGERRGGERKIGKRELWEREERKGKGGVREWVIGGEV